MNIRSGPHKCWNTDTKCLITIEKKRKEKYYKFNTTAKKKEHNTVTNHVSFYSTSSVYIFVSNADKNELLFKISFKLVSWRMKRSLIGEYVPQSIKKRFSSGADTEDMRLKTIQTYKKQDRKPSLVRLGEIHDVRNVYSIKLWKLFWRSRSSA